MKTYTGSLQRRGRRYYLVVHRLEKQRWFALKTDKLPVARMRAAKIAPADPDDEAAWLMQLVRVGENARRILVALRARRDLTWENIASVCREHGGLSRSDDGMRSHERWLSILAAFVRQTARAVQPGALTGEQAEMVIQKMSERYVSAPRMLTFFRRAWRLLGLDEGIWPQRMPLGVGDRVKAGEHYRRLTLDEIRRVHTYLSDKAPALADMLLIGYSTGLRLSDVAELERAEIQDAFLLVCPNKTRLRKPKPLRIPLTPEAQGVVGRLLAGATAQKGGFVFSEGDRHRPSRKIARAFRKCGVLREGNGRASFHSLRATFISLMDEAGIPPHVTDSVTGHGGGGMHARYTQPSDAALMASVMRAIPAVSLPSLPSRPL